MKYFLLSMARDRRLVIGILLMGFLAAAEVKAADDPFAAGVRATDPVSPEQQRLAFKVPPGFEMQLVAHEPDINKPLNMAFDVLGRLWVTTSIEYPFPAPTNRLGRDRVMIFEDFAPDGRARKVTQFAGELNIPIGIYPLTGARRSLARGAGAQGLFGNAAIVWSIPHIWLMEDTDGDGTADKREPLYGPFDYTRDTHGNQASFRRGFDGWLYATHGFNNDSRVKGRDGHLIHMNSGNTYRMRLDGERLEHHTFGQVNPFGLAWDPSGNLYSSDCHSAPTYQLLAGGYYPSFGKPHDGLGFAPVLMEHSHGSTAIDGMLYYADDLWPAEFHDNIFVGNVMTSRVNRDKLAWHGSSPQAIEQDDLVKCEDPWFRPVDNQLGPDGAFYIADFYNRIIGHYEVPLTHPGRDRERGRIWRLVYKGADDQARTRPAALASDLEGLAGELASPNLTRRMLAMNALADRFGQEAVKRLQAALASPVNVFQKVHALWLLHRLDALDLGQIRLAPEHRLVRVHAQRVAADVLHRAVTPGPMGDSGRIGSALDYALAGLKDPDPLVQRCAAEAVGYFPSPPNVTELLALLNRAPAADTHLIYVVRKALRDQLRNDKAFDAVLAKDWPAGDLRALADVALAVKSERAGSFLNRELGRLNWDRGMLTSALQHIARYAPVSELDALGGFVRSKFGEDLDLQLALYNSVAAGAEQRGSKLSASLRAWGADLCARALASGVEAGWHNIPIEDAPTANPWGFEMRHCEDGQRARLLSSLPNGEQLTGLLRSEEFVIPERLSFYLAGHDGFPDKAAGKKNGIRLRIGGEAAAEAFAPRNDMARKVAWDLSAWAGKRGVMEAVDADAGGAYAWLAFGRFEPAVLSLPDQAPSVKAKRQSAAAEIAARIGLGAVTGDLAGLTKNKQADWESRAAAAKALLALDPGRGTAAAIGALADAGELSVFRARLGELLAEQKTVDSVGAVAAAMKTAPYRTQARWAVALASSAIGAEGLLEAVATGAAAPRLLQSVGIKNRIQASQPRDWERRLAKLTENLTPADEVRERLLLARRVGFGQAKTDLTEGKRLFQQNCAACHRIGSEGALVGPQLDGIGHRGLERLTEDTLDPNRNVDSAFRSHNVFLKDGEVMTGLPRREEGELLILADSTGKEVSVAKSKIERRVESEVSLMPDNFGEALTPEQFNHLMAFLLSERGESTR